MIEWLKHHTGVSSLVGFVLLSGITVATEETIKAATMATYDFVCGAIFCNPAPPPNNPDAHPKPPEDKSGQPPRSPEATRQPEEDKRTKDAIDRINQIEIKVIDRISAK